MKYQPVRGTHDIFGFEIDQYNIIVKKINELARIYNFKEIKTPIFESTKLFSKPLGDQSDVVLKEMYTFLDRNKDSLTLRPEYTTPMIRAAISNNLLKQLPCKLYGIGSMFRRERPQKGRYRQFNQINFENFGSTDSFADVELILLANNFIKSILPNLNFKLYINSLGDRETLNKYKKQLSNYLLKYKKELSEDSKDKIIKNPIRILDSKNKNDKDIISAAPAIIEFLSKDALNQFNEIKNILKNFNIKFEEKYSLVRGLDYYCHTVFEFKTEDLGTQDTIIGGGRYDGLVSLLGGNDISGVGWAGGVERIMMLMKKTLNENSEIHLAIIDEKFKSYGFEIYKFLTDNQIPVYWNYKYNLKKSLSISNTSKASFIIIIGEDEYNKKKCTIKNLKSGEQKMLHTSELINSIKNA